MVKFMCLFPTRTVNTLSLDTYFHSEIIFSTCVCMNMLKIFLLT